MARLLTDVTEKPFGHGLHAAGEQVTDMASLVPVQLAAPPLVQRECGFAECHSVVPGTNDEATLRWWRRLDGLIVDGRGGLRSSR